MTWSPHRPLLPQMKTQNDSMMMTSRSMGVGRGRSAGGWPRKTVGVMGVGRGRSAGKFVPQRA